MVTNGVRLAGDRQAYGWAAVGCVLTILVGGWAVPAEVAAAPPALQQASALRAEGRFPEALEVLRAESRKIKSAEGDASRRLLPINDLAAEILVDSGDLEVARSLLEKTIATRRKLVDGGWHEAVTDLGKSHLTLARLETAAKRWPAAAGAARQAMLTIGGVLESRDASVATSREALVAALDALEDALGAGSNVTRQSRDEAAQAFTALGFYAEAIEQRRKNLEGILAMQEPDAGEVVEASRRLGQSMVDAGFANQAVQPVEKALAALKPTDVKEAHLIRRLLGELQFAADHMALAAGSFELAREAAQGDAKPSAADEALDRLWFLRVGIVRGQVDRLPDWFEPTVKTLSRPLPAEASTATRALVVAAGIQQALAMPTPAIETLSRALALASNARPPDGGHVAELLGRVADGHLSAGQIPAARKAVEQALSKAEQELGPGDPRVSYLRILLADAQRREGLNDEASALAAKALERGLPRPSDSWEERATTIYDAIADACGDDELRERYVVRRAEQFGSDHPHVGSAYRLFGAARLAAGDWQAAMNYFSRALDLQKAVSGEDDPDVAAGLVMLAQAERMAGKSRDAVATAARGVTAWERVAGPEHPGTISAVDVLVEAKIQAGDSSGVPELLERLCGAGSSGDPVRQAGHLVRRAGFTVAKDKARSRELVAEAMKLPCWQPDAAIGASDRVRLALSAALAAHVSRQAGDAEKATALVQQARGFALQAEEPKAILDRIEELASRGEQPVARP